MLRKVRAKRHMAALMWLLRPVIKKRRLQGKWPVFPEFVGRMHKCFLHSQSGCHERECQSKVILKGLARDFPGSPVVKTLHFHCRGHRFDPWLGS